MKQDIFLHAVLFLFTAIVYNKVLSVGKLFAHLKKNITPERNFVKQMSNQTKLRIYNIVKTDLNYESETQTLNNGDNVWKHTDRDS